MKHAADCFYLTYLCINPVSSPPSPQGLVTKLEVVNHNTVRVYTRSDVLVEGPASGTYRWVGSTGAVAPSSTYGFLSAIIELFPLNSSTPCYHNTHSGIFSKSDQWTASSASWRMLRSSLALPRQTKYLSSLCRRDLSRPPSWSCCRPSCSLELHTGGCEPHEVDDVTSVRL